MIQKTKHQSFILNTNKTERPIGIKTIKLRFLHLGELVRCTTSDLSNTEQGEFSLEVFKLSHKISFGFLPQLMNLDPCYKTQHKSISDINYEKLFDLRN
jgi:hypothetical protein